MIIYLLYANNSAFTSIVNETATKNRASIVCKKYHKLINSYGVAFTNHPVLIFMASKHNMPEDLNCEICFSLNAKKKTTTKMSVSICSVWTQLLCSYSIACKHRITLDFVFLFICVNGMNGMVMIVLLLTLIWHLEWLILCTQYRCAK